jgi:hypothetical protein
VIEFLLRQAVASTILLAATLSLLAAARRAHPAARHGLIVIGLLATLYVPFLHQVLPSMSLPWTWLEVPSPIVRQVPAALDSTVAIGAQSASSSGFEGLSIGSLAVLLILAGVLWHFSCMLVATVALARVRKQLDFNDWDPLLVRRCAQ